MKSKIQIIIRFAIIANLLFSGCALRVYEDGKLLVSDSSNSNGTLDIHSRHGTTVSFTGSRDNSTPTKVALHGAHKIFADAVTGAVGLSGANGVGNSVVPALAKGGAIIAPQVNSPTSNSPSVK